MIDFPRDSSSNQEAAALAAPPVALCVDTGEHFEVTCCPFCGGLHRHGRIEGHRAAHCRDRSPEAERWGYTLRLESIETSSDSVDRIVSSYDEARMGHDVRALTREEATAIVERANAGNATDAFYVQETRNGTIALGMSATGGICFTGARGRGR